MYIRSYKIIQRTVDHEKSGFIDPSIVHMDHGWLSDKPHLNIAVKSLHLHIRACKY